MLPPLLVMCVKATYVLNALLLVKTINISCKYALIALKCVNYVVVTSIASNAIQNATLKAVITTFVKVALNSIIISSGMLQKLNALSMNAKSAINPIYAYLQL